jgi:hypothetical protein
MGGKVAPAAARPWVVLMALQWRQTTAVRLKFKQNQ